MAQQGNNDGLAEKLVMTCGGGGEGGLHVVAPARRLELAPALASIARRWRPTSRRAWLAQPITGVFDVMGASHRIGRGEALEGGARAAGDRQAAPPVGLTA